MAASQFGISTPGRCTSRPHHDRDGRRLRRWRENACGIDHGADWPGRHRRPACGDVCEASFVRAAQGRLDLSSPAPTPSDRHGLGAVEPKHGASRLAQGFSYSYRDAVAVRSRLLRSRKRIGSAPRALDLWPGAASALVVEIGCDENHRGHWALSALHVANIAEKA